MNIDVKKLLTGAFWKRLAKSVASPYGAVSAAAAVVTILGEVGVLNSGQSGAIEALLSAALGVVVAFAHTGATTKIAKKQQPPAA